MTTTKIYQNTSTEDVNVIGVGVIPAGEQVSITSEYHQPVVLSNYPGLIDLTAQEENTAVEAPVAPVETGETDNGQTL